MRHLPPFALAAVLGLSACSSTSNAPSAGAGPSSAAPTSSGAATSAITISGFAYNDPTVAPGATVTVTNVDAAEHTVTPDTNGAFTAVDVEKGSPMTFKAPTTPGRYTFHCAYHASMHGTLTVR
jgi:plastocyanin